MSQPTPTQESAAKDLHGFEWRLKHKFRVDILIFVLNLEDKVWDKFGGVSGISRELGVYGTKGEF
ncbi:hypothetical protein Sjap_003394 [Stephania japonica]|uniref:Uncharacterized protein n=1 Tax=Stephania japonica TaxID=461633 RepID=A0AAP0KQE5_9MAGN